MASLSLPAVRELLTCSSWACVCVCVCVCVCGMRTPRTSGRYVEACRPGWGGPVHATRPVRRTGPRASPPCRISTCIIRARPINCLECLVLSEGVVVFFCFSKSQNAILTTFLSHSWAYTVFYFFF